MSMNDKEYSQGATRSSSAGYGGILRIFWNLCWRWMFWSGFMKLFCATDTMLLVVNFV